MAAIVEPLRTPFCERKGSVCDNHATHTVSLLGVGSLGGRYCENCAQAIADSVNREIDRDRKVFSESR